MSSELQNLWNSADNFLLLYGRLWLIWGSKIERPVPCRVLLAELFAIKRYAFSLNIKQLIVTLAEFLAISWYWTHYFSSEAIKSRRRIFTRVILILRLSHEVLLFNIANICRLWLGQLVFERLNQELNIIQWIYLIS